MSVRLKGVHRRTATDDTKECASALCAKPRIAKDQDYARVLRHDDRIEMFHVQCFEEEFGEALRA